MDASERSRDNQGLQGSHNRHNQALISSADHHNNPAPFSSTTNQFPITENQHFGGGGGKRVIYVSDPTSIKERPKVPLSDFTKPCSRLVWTQKLHDRFVEAMEELGGPDRVTPKNLRQAMAVEGLTLDHLKSHLQSYRNGKISLKDMHESSQNSATSTKEPSRENESSSSTGKNISKKKKKCGINARKLKQQIQVGNEAQMVQPTDDDGAFRDSESEPWQEYFNFEKFKNGPCSLQVPETATTSTVQAQNDKALDDDDTTLASIWKDMSEATPENPLEAFMNVYDNIPNLDVSDNLNFSMPFESDNLNDH